VANVSQGTIVVWNGVTLGEVVNVSVDGVACDSVEVTSRYASSGASARLKKYSPADIDLGTVTLTCRGTSGMTQTNVGLTGTLSITGPSVTWSFGRALFERLGWSASVGELQTYSVTFKLGA